jgi:hypothetical protein
MQYAGESTYQGRDSLFETSEASTPFFKLQKPQADYGDRSGTFESVNGRFRDGGIYAYPK